MYDGLIRIVFVSMIVTFFQEKEQGMPDLMPRLRLSVSFLPST